MEDYIVGELIINLENNIVDWIHNRILHAQGIRDHKVMKLELHRILTDTFTLYSELGSYLPKEIATKIKEQMVK